jgi:hypothetical protein
MGIGNPDTVRGKEELIPKQMKNLETEKGRQWCADIGSTIHVLKERNAISFMSML